MNAKRNQITVDGEVAAVLRRFVTGELRDCQVHPNGDVTFEIDDDVAAELERYRQPGDDESTLLRRALKLGAGIDVPLRKMN